MVSWLQDEATRYLDIGPVNKVLNMLACWFEDPGSEHFARYFTGIHCVLHAGVIHGIVMVYLSLRQ